MNTQPQPKRQFKMTVPTLVGTRVAAVGEVLEAEDKIAARIVGLGHAVYVAAIAGSDPETEPHIEDATQPIRGEQAVSKKPR